MKESAPVRAAVDNARNGKSHKSDIRHRTTPWQQIACGDTKVRQESRRRSARSNGGGRATGSTGGGWYSWSPTSGPFLGGPGSPCASAASRACAPTRSPHRSGCKTTNAPSSSPTAKASSSRSSGVLAVRSRQSPSRLCSDQDQHRDDRLSEQAIAPSGLVRAAQVLGRVRDVEDEVRQRVDEQR